MNFQTQQRGRGLPAELVNKTVTSAPRLILQRLHHALKKRVRRMARKLCAVQKQQQRIAQERGLYAVAVTLTYADDKRFEGKHVTRFIDCLRKKLKRAGHFLPYTWVFERASSLHYHFMLWLPRGFKLNFTDLQKWWPWGSTWCESCTSVTGWRKYLSKGASKANLPHGARVFSYGGLDEAGDNAVAWATLPAWLRRNLQSKALPCRFKGCGWLETDTGEIHMSPFIWTPRGIKYRKQEGFTEFSTC